MGLKHPPCPECLCTTGWASAHFTQWEAFLFSSLHPPLPPNPEILEVGSWEGMSAIWLSHRLAARSITCVDTWQGGPDQHGAFADAVLPGTIRPRHLPSCRWLDQRSGTAGIAGVRCERLCPRAVRMKLAEGPAPCGRAARPAPRARAMGEATCQGGYVGGGETRRWWGGGQLARPFSV